MNEKRQSPLRLDRKRKANRDRKINLRWTFRCEEGKELDRTGEKLEVDHI